MHACSAFINSIMLEFIMVSTYGGSRINFSISFYNSRHVFSCPTMICEVLFELLNGKRKYTKITGHKCQECDKKCVNFKKPSCSKH